MAKLNQTGKFSKHISLLFILLGTLNLQAQKISERVNVLPFRDGSRPDSINVEIERARALVESRKYFEKSYIDKKLVFIPCDSVLFDWSGSAMFFNSKGIESQGPGKPTLASNRKKFICDIRENLKKSIQNSNKLIRHKNKFRRKEIAQNPQSQMELLKLEKLEDYEIIFIHKSNFTYVDEKNPRENLVYNGFRNMVEQIVLGKPYNLYGFINSKNFTQVNFDQEQLPDLIKTLIQENLKIAISLISDASNRSKVDNITLDFRDVSGHQKFWINTDVANRIIYLSPYLIRAVFNISYYQLDLLKLVERTRDKEELSKFFRGKGSATVSEIDNAYFSNFVELFSKNIQFIFSHELAHFYIYSTDERMKEIDCDKEALSLLEQNFENYDLGIFKTLLIKSIERGELDYWGNAIRKDWLIERYYLLDSKSID